MPQTIQWTFTMKNKLTLLVATALLLTAPCLAHDPVPGKTTKAELLQAVDALKVQIQNLPDEGPVVPPPPPHDDNQHPPVQIPGEGWKIATHAGLIPDLSANPTHTLHSGDFPIDLPADARVLIPAGAAVTLHSSLDQRIESIAVKGTLIFSRTANTKLRVGTILCYPGSVFDQGTVDDPIVAKSHILFDGSVPATDPEQITVGLIAFGGSTPCKISIQGEFAGTATTELFAPIAAGATTITVKDATGWKVGDRIILHDSQDVIDPARFYTTAERRTITEVRVTTSTVAGSSRTIVLDQPLQYAHDGDVDHLSRNIVYSQTPETRAHTIAMGACDVRMASAEVLLSGRSQAPQPIDDTVRKPDNSVLHLGTNQRGRYAVHMHHVSRPFAIDRLVIETPVPHSRWALSHHTGHGTVTNCIANNFYGAGIVGEAGTETGLHKGNSIMRQLLPGSTSLQGGPDYPRFNSRDAAGRLMEDRGHGGYGAWYRGPFIAVEDCKFNGWAIEGFSWNLEADFHGPLPQMFTLRPIEGRDPAQVGTFDFEVTDTVPVKRCKATMAMLSGESGGMTFWGTGGLNTIDSCFVKKQNYFGGTAWGCLHNNGCRAIIKNCRTVVSPVVNSAYRFQQSDGMQALTIDGLTDSGYVGTALISPQHLQSITAGGYTVNGTVMNPAVP